MIRKASGEMEKMEREKTTVDDRQEQILHSMLTERQTQLGQEEMERWKNEKKANRTRLIFILWITLFIAVMGELLLVRIVQGSLPGPEQFGVRDFLVTPTTVWFVAGLFGFLVRKLLKQPYWNWKSTVAAVIGGVLVLIAPVIQAVVVALYVLLVIMPGWYIYSFFANL